MHRHRMWVDQWKDVIAVRKAFSINFEGINDITIFNGMLIMIIILTVIDNLSTPAHTNIISTETVAQILQKIEKKPALYTEVMMFQRWHNFSHSSAANNQDNTGKLLIKFLEMIDNNSDQDLLNSELVLKFC